MLAEKASVRDAIAAAVGGLEKRKAFGQPYWEGKDLLVTAARGHLVRIPSPAPRVTLPIFPSPFKLEPVKESKALLDLYQALARKAVALVNACDAGREGELIFRRIVQYLHLEVMPSERLWLQSLTPEAIRDAFDQMRSEADMRPLAAAAQRRQEADWLVGINATGALWKGSWMPKTFSVGRVRTPTLSMVVDREAEIQNFTPKPYEVVTALFCSRDNSQNYRGSRSTIDDDAEALVKFKSAWCSWAAGTQGTIWQEHHETTSVAPPKLFNLAELQREAARECACTPQETLTLAQSLYENKYITYPRTDSRFLPEDYRKVAQEVLAVALSKASQQCIKTQLLQQAMDRVGVVDTSVFNNAKVSDHFAIIPTVKGMVAPDTMKESKARQVLQLVQRRFVVVFLPPARYRELHRVTEVDGYHFETQQKDLVELGFLEAEGDVVLSTAPAAEVLAQGSRVLLAARPETAEKLTQAPARYTQTTLLTAMENCGRRIRDKALRDGLRAGIGTSATRAGIIGELLKKGLLTAGGRRQQGLQPGPGATELVQCLRGPLTTPDLASPELTASWEILLLRIERGDASSQASFDAGLRQFVEAMVGKALGSKGPVIKTTSTRGAKDSVSVVKCGRLKGLTFEEAEKNDPSYCNWVLSLQNLQGPLAPFAEYLRWTRGARETQGPATADRAKSKRGPGRVMDAESVAEVTEAQAGTEAGVEAGSESCPGRGSSGPRTTGGVQGRRPGRPKKNAATHAEVQNMAEAHASGVREKPEAPGRRKATRGRKEALPGQSDGQALAQCEAAGAVEGMQQAAGSAETGCVQPKRRPGRPKKTASDTQAKA